MEQTDLETTEKIPDRSRRKFLKWGAALGAAAVAGEALRPVERVIGAITVQDPVFADSLLAGTMSTPDLLTPPDPLFSPKLVSEVEVFGFKNPIKTLQQMDELNVQFDRKFISEHQLGPNVLGISNRLKIREEHLNPRERYLEVVVRKSAYDRFLARKPDTQVDFVEWIKMHVDALNRIMENAKPPSEMSVVLRRIVIVDDALSADWSEERWKKGGEALDWWWANRFSERYPLDIDTSWAIGTDYRVDTLREKSQGNFWSANHDRKGNLVFRFPARGKPTEQSYTYPPKDDSLTGKNGVWLDLGLIHEWTHYLLNLPDVYNFDFQNAPFRFSKFFMRGDTTDPWLSPYLSILLSNHIKKKLRSPWQQGLHGGYSYNEAPKDIKIALTEKGAPLKSRIQVYYAKSLPKGGKLFDYRVDYDASGDNCSITRDFFRNDANLCYIRVESGGRSREVYMPAAAFNMSKIMGVENAQYNLEFTGEDDYSKRTQVVHQVDETELDSFLKERQENKETVYAKMKVMGTPTYFVWVLGS